MPPQKPKPKQNPFPNHPALKHLTNVRPEVVAKLHQAGEKRRAKEAADLAPPAAGPANSQTKSSFKHGEDESS
jgi:hypothetical protein